MSYDAIVLGLGGMGSSAAYHLARRKRRVLGIEQFTPGHARGASHGRTRVIRQSYYEDPAYVPLLLRAYELWRESRPNREMLLSEVGGLMIGRPDSEVVRGSTRSARAYGLKHEILDAAELRRRFPPLSPDADTVALYEEKAGFVRPEMGVTAHLRCAAARGADLHFEERALGWEAVGDRVVVTTDRGRYEGDRLIISPGPWAPAVLADLGLPLAVERQVLYWIDPAGGVEPFLPDRFPIFIWEIGAGETVYGFPALDGPRGGVKVAFYRAPQQQLCTPDNINRVIRPDEVERMKAALAGRIPALNNRYLDGVTCMYTNTPDKNFIITVHPKHPRVSVACGFSGHGYKFCSVVGEILADLADGGTTRHDIGLFNLARLVR